MLNLEIDDKAALASIADIAGNQAPFAFSLGINRTMTGARDSMRELITKEFTISLRRVPFLQSLIRFPRSQWATKTKLSATMGVHQTDAEVGSGSGSSTDRGFLLGRHEEEHQANANPLQPFFIPTSVIRPDAYAEAPRSLYPAALGLMAGRGVVGYLTSTNATTGKKQRKAVIGMKSASTAVTDRGFMKGKQKTFLIGPSNTANAKQWGIYQRTGTGRNDVRLIWSLRQHIRLHDLLHFNATFERYVEAHLEEEISKAIDVALATAR